MGITDRNNKSFQNATKTGSLTCDLVVPGPLARLGSKRPGSVAVSILKIILFLLDKQPYIPYVI